MSESADQDKDGALFKQENKEPLSTKFQQGKTTFELY